MEWIALAARCVALRACFARPWGCIAIACGGITLIAISVHVVRFSLFAVDRVLFYFVILYAAALGAPIRHAIYYV